MVFSRSVVLYLTVTLHSPEPRPPQHPFYLATNTVCPGLVRVVCGGSLVMGFVWGLSFLRGVFPGICGLGGYVALSGKGLTAPSPPRGGMVDSGSGLVVESWYGAGMGFLLRFFSVKRVMWLWIFLHGIGFFTFPCELGLS
ncbi:hypothetical protein Tco_0327961 [Tanacetum coccineum]